MLASPRPSARQLITGALFVASFAALFWPTFRWMAERFNAYDSFYSHGWLVPLASGWLIWQRRDALKRVQPQASSAGLLLLIPFVVVHVLASWWQLHFLSGFAMVGAVWGLVWAVWGSQTLWVLRDPLLFLLFMVPLPGVLLISVSFRMKLLAASLAAHLLQLMHLPALQAGSMIRLPGLSVIVDDTCSGLRSLMSLITLSTLWITLMPPSSSRWQKLSIVAASIPIALVANMLRILVLVLTATIYGPKAAEGFIHYGAGLVVFGTAVLALVWLTKTVQGWSQPSVSRG